MTPASRSLEPAGVLVIDKPVGPTSHDIVALVRRRLGCRTGHTGTLDPGASGVLPLVTGRATRLSGWLQAGDKEYQVDLQLGVTTDTYDWQGRETARRPVPELTDTEVEAVLQQQRGTLPQTVPPFSAVRVGGERLYRSARRGETRQLPSRTVEVSGLSLLRRSRDRWTLLIECSAGTYVRSLVHDLGTTLGCGAMVTALRRLRAGPFSLADAVAVEDIEREGIDKLVPMEALLPELPALTLGPEEADRIRHGNSIDRSDSPGTCRLFADQLLIALGEADGEVVRPKVVLRAE